MDTSSAIHIVLGLLLLSGLLLGLVAARFGLPRVAAYVLAMLLILPDGLGGLPPTIVALVFAAIAAPTAPAATIAVLHQYHARGALSSTLLGVVALDDAVGIVFFALLAVATTADARANHGSAYKPTTPTRKPKPMFTSFSQRKARRETARSGSVPCPS